MKTNTLKIQQNAQQRALLNVRTLGQTEVKPPHQAQWVTRNVSRFLLIEIY